MTQPQPPQGQQIAVDPQRLALMWQQQAQAEQNERMMLSTVVAQLQEENALLHAEVDALRTKIDRDSNTVAEPHTLDVEPAGNGSVSTRP